MFLFISGRFVGSIHVVFGAKMPTFYLSTLDRTWGVEIKGWMYFLLGMDREFGNFATLDDLEMNWFFLFSRL